MDGTQVCALGMGACSIRIYVNSLLPPIKPGIVGRADHSLASHTLRRREEGSGHAATIELSPRQKLVVTNQIRALRRSHPLSWSTITSQRV